MHAFYILMINLYSIIFYIDFITLLKDISFLKATLKFESK